MVRSRDENSPIYSKLSVKDFIIFYVCMRDCDGVTSIEYTCTIIYLLRRGIFSSTNDQKET